MNARNAAHIGDGPARTSVIELGTMVTVDGRRRGVLVGRSFSAKDETLVYDVRLPADKTILNIAAQRVKAAGPARCDVIGRDLPHNPKRTYLTETEEAGERAAAIGRSTSLRSVVAAAFRTLSQGAAQTGSVSV
jgi:hypothetical protein